MTSSDGGSLAGRRAVCLYDYQNEADEILSIRAGEEIQVVQSLGQGWLLGTNSSGAIGKFPKAIVKFQASESVNEPRPSTDTQRQIDHSRAKGSRDTLEEKSSTQERSHPIASQPQVPLLGRLQTQAGVSETRTRYSRLSEEAHWDQHEDVGGVPVTVNNTYSNDSVHSQGSPRIQPQDVVDSSEHQRRIAELVLLADHNGEFHEVWESGLPSYEELYTALKSDSAEEDTLYRQPSPPPSAVSQKDQPQENDPADLAPIPVSSEIAESEATATRPVSDEPCAQCSVTNFGNAFCNECKVTFCNSCWSVQFMHREGSSQGITHERTSLDLAKKIQRVLQRPSNQDATEDNFREDAETSWFGVVREEGEVPSFQDYGRYANLIASTRAIPQNDTSTIISEDIQSQRRFPSVVSFVGETGAGKSSIIKLLIDLDCPVSHDFATPVVGAAGSTTPTSDDVHLYLDPTTVSSNCPLLYADCEGLKGGQREPIAAKFKKNTRRFRRAEVDDPEAALQKRNYTSRRELMWPNDAQVKSREFAVSDLYPRLLYTFSDVIVFILKNPKKIEDVFEKLILWAAAALETSSNQPVLPHAIIVLNALPTDINPDLWNTEYSTHELLQDLARVVNANRVFIEKARFWRDKERQINSAEDLILSYYSSIKIIRIPDGQRPSLCGAQLSNLHGSISEACANAREKKASLRMLLDDQELEPYLQFAFDHFAETLDTPFDFVQASFFNSPIPHDFGGNILKLLINMMDVRPEATAHQLLKDLGRMVASCIMIDSTRNKLIGSAIQIFPEYMEYLDSALRDFADRHWPCEYVKPGTTFRCVNVRSGHDSSKGHQLASGKILAVGEYESKFSFESYRRVFEATVYLHLKQLLEKLKKRGGFRESEEKTAANLHKELTLQPFFMNISDQQPERFVNHTVCYACLLDPPEHVLPCGHIICTACARSCGSVRDDCIDINNCPLETQPMPKSRKFYIKPESAGIRMLTLDGGGVRGIVELLILEQIERELHNRLPIQALFDMIVGTSTGGIIALGLGVRGWSVRECRKAFEDLCDKAFTRRRGGNFFLVGWLIDNHNHSKYKTKPFRDALTSAFTDYKELFGGRGEALSDFSYGGMKVAVTATLGSGSSAVLANYNRPCSESLPYHFARPERPEAELKIWEAARATSAAPKIFKPFHHELTKQVYLDGAIYHNNPINVADRERKLIWPSLRPLSPDIIVSLGTAMHTGGSDLSKAPSEAKVPRLGVPSHLSSLLKIAQDHIAASLDSEKTWESYVGTVANKREDRKRFARINPNLLDAPPALDDVAAMKKLQAEVGGWVKDNVQIKNVALQLVATMFYFQVTEVIDFEKRGSAPAAKGHIRCRLPKRSLDHRPLAQLLREKSGKEGPRFLIQEQGLENGKYIDLTESDLRKMEQALSYESKLITIPLTSYRAVTEILLVYGTNGQHMLSGLPRSIYQVDAPQKRNRQSSTMASFKKKREKIRQHKEWVPPTEKDAVWIDSRETRATRATNDLIELPAQQVPARFSSAIFKGTTTEIRRHVDYVASQESSPYFSSSNTTGGQQEDIPSAPDRSETIHELDTIVATGDNAGTIFNPNSANWRNQSYDMEEGVRRGLMTLLFSSRDR